MRGLLLALEGLDGAGKSTQVAALARRLSQAGQVCHVLRLYGNEILNRQFGGLNSSSLIGAREAALMTAADLAGRMESFGLPALQRGEIILWDKYLVGSRARDRARGMPDGLLAAIYDPLPAPDLTIFFDLPPEQAVLRKRGDGGPKLWESGLDVALKMPVAEINRRLAEGAITPGAVERQFVKFQGDVRAGYEELLDPRRTVRVDAARPHEEIAAAVWDLTLSLRSRR
jgi:dTMP kinase